MEVISVAEFIWETFTGDIIVISTDKMKVEDHTITHPHVMKQMKEATHTLFGAVVSLLHPPLLIP